MAARVEGNFWLVSVFIRFLWVLYPQTGYIHPDEYFQSPEISAGEVFGFQTLRTWEFNETFPIRSILFPHVTTGLPFKVLQKLHSIFNHSSWVLNTWTLIVVPRLVYCSISLVIDLSAYKISKIIDIDPVPVLFAIGTSYVTLVFHTRPFSNSLESVLFSLLLWMITVHICSTNKIVTKRWQRQLRNLGIGIVVTTGVWNRPTFLVFAFFPGLSWFYSFYKRNDPTKLPSRPILELLRETGVVICGVVMTSLLFISVDSIYYGTLSTNIKQLTITPLNFIIYNLDTSKIKEHGLHPRFTHFLVNMPLLYGILTVLFFLFLLLLIHKRDFVKCLSVFLLINDKDIQEFTNHKRNQNKSLHSKILILKLMTVCVVVPVALLSVIPHQEARFLNPILLPLAILFGHFVAGPRQSLFTNMSWIIWNLMGCVIFGIVHQGGMYSSLAYLQKYLATPASVDSEFASIHLVFSNTYMPPRYLLAWPKDVSDFKGCQSCHKQLFVHDLGGQSREELFTWLDQLVVVVNEKKKQGNYTEVFLVCPSTLHFSHPLFFKEKQFIPHISIEDPPDFSSILHFTSTVNCEIDPGNRYVDNQQHCRRTSKDESIVSSLSNWFNSELSLNLYKLETMKLL